MPQNPFDVILLNARTIYFFDVVINVLIAFVLGLLISLAYRFTYKGFSYSASFVNTLILISMITCLVIMIIGNNLARAFGLVGAMSIIRFRTAVKDSRDIAFVFFSLAAGLAAGAGNHMIGVVGVILSIVVVLVLYIANYGSVSSTELLLRFWMIPSDTEKPPYLDVFEKYLKSYRLVNMRSARLGEYLELSFNVKFHKNKEHQALIRELNGIEGIERISLVMGEESNEPI